MVGFILLFFLLLPSFGVGQVVKHEKCISNQNLRVTGVGLRPYFDTQVASDGLPSGVDMDIVRILAKRLNTNVSFQISNTWGVKRNGFWTGTVGEVHNGSADLGIGHISLNYFRQRDIDYLTPVYFTTAHLVTSKPKPQPQHFNILKPFSGLSWLALWATIFIAILLRYSFFKFVLAKAFSKSYQEAMHFCASCFEQSVPDLRPNKRCSSFIMTASWLFFTTLIIMGYKCNFRALLVSVDYEPPINNALDLIKYDRPLYIDRGAAIIVLLKESPYEVFRELHKRIVENDQFFRSRGRVPLSMELKIKNEGAVILMTELMFQTKAWDMKKRHGSQLLRMGDEPFRLSFSGFIVQKESCLKPLLDKNLQYMIQNGIIAKVMMDNSPNLIINKEQQNDDLEVLTMDHILLALFSLIIGLMTSGVVFLVERKWAKEQLEELWHLDVPRDKGFRL